MSRQTTIMGVLVILHAQLERISVIMQWKSGTGITKPIFSVPVFPHFFQHCQNIVTLIFYRCCRSSAAVVPVRCERDFRNLTGTCIRSKEHITEKLLNGALVAPLLKGIWRRRDLGKSWFPISGNGLIQFDLVNLCPVIDLGRQN